MDKNIEPLMELKEQFLKVIGVENKRPILDVVTINNFCGYVSALSNAIEMMEDVVDDSF